MVLLSFGKFPSKGIFLNSFAWFESQAAARMSPYSRITPVNQQWHTDVMTRLSCSTSHTHQNTLDITGSPSHITQMNPSWFTVHLWTLHSLPPGFTMVDGASYWTQDSWNLTSPGSTMVERAPHSHQYSSIPTFPTLHNLPCRLKTHLFRLHLVPRFLVIIIKKEIQK